MEQSGEENKDPAWKWVFGQRVKCNNSTNSFSKYSLDKSAVSSQSECWNPGTLNQCA